jgi:hypothetical protein
VEAPERGRALDRLGGAQRRATASRSDAACLMRPISGLV